MSSGGEYPETSIATEHFNSAASELIGQPGFSVFPESQAWRGHLERAYAAIADARNERPVRTSLIASCLRSAMSAAGVTPLSTQTEVQTGVYEAYRTYNRIALRAAELSDAIERRLNSIATTLRFCAALEPRGHSGDAPLVTASLRIRYAVITHLVHFELQQDRPEVWRLLEMSESQSDTSLAVTLDRCWDIATRATSDREAAILSLLYDVIREETSFGMDEPGVIAVSELDYRRQLPAIREHFDYDAAWLDVPYLSLYVRFLLHRGWQPELIATHLEELCGIATNRRDAFEREESDLYEDSDDASDEGAVVGALPTTTARSELSASNVRTVDLTQVERERLNDALFSQISGESGEAEDVASFLFTYFTAKRDKEIVWVEFETVQHLRQLVLAKLTRELGSGADRLVRKELLRFVGSAAEAAYIFRELNAAPQQTAAENHRIIELH